VFVLALFFCLTAAAQTPIDFSYAGYAGGGVSAPMPPALISVRPGGGDDTALLQGALDHVSALSPPGKRFSRRSVVAARALSCSRTTRNPDERRSAASSGNATIVASGKGRRTLIEIGNATDPVTGPPVRITDETVPPEGAP